MRPRVLETLVLLTLLLGAHTAAALPSDRAQPIHVTADRADINDKARISVFTGHVVLVQGSLHLWSDTLTVHYDAHGKITELRAQGDPARFRQQPKPDARVIDGSARNLRYDVQSGVLLLRDHAELVQGSNRFRGPQIEYDSRRDLVHASTPGQNRGRVEITLQPTQKPEPQGTPSGARAGDRRSGTR